MLLQTVDKTMGQTTITLTVEVGIKIGMSGFSSHQCNCRFNPERNQ